MQKRFFSVSPNVQEQNRITIELCVCIALHMVAYTDKSNQFSGVGCRSQWLCGNIQRENEMRKEQKKEHTANKTARLCAHIAL